MGARRYRVEVLDSEWVRITANPFEGFPHQHFGYLNGFSPEVLWESIALGLKPSLNLNDLRIYAWSWRPPVFRGGARLSEKRDEDGLPEDNVLFEGSLSALSGKA